VKPPAATAFDKQPEPWHVDFDGIAVKQMHFVQKGYVAAQHVHEYDHYTFLAKGSLRAWVDGEHVGDFVAPTPIFIGRGREHIFVSLEDDTVAYCVHNLHGAAEPSVIAAGKLPKE
jgi:quercetin dioxygenase-like cupin family protein